MGCSAASLGSPHWTPVASPPPPDLWATKNVSRHWQMSHERRKSPGWDPLHRHKSLTKRRISIKLSSQHLVCWCPLPILICPSWILPFALLWPPLRMPAMGLAYFTVENLHILNSSLAHLIPRQIDIPYKRFSQAGPSLFVFAICSHPQTELFLWVFISLWGPS